MKLSLVPLLRCPVCSGSPLDPDPFEVTDDGRCRAGILSCPACSAWYPIDDLILELLPPDVEEEGSRARFYELHRSRLEELGVPPPEAGEAGRGDSPQDQQRRYFDEWARDPECSYTAFREQPFQRAHRELTYSNWRPSLADGSLLLDIGCGDGTSTFDLAEPGIEVLAFDISRGQIAQAVRRAESEGQRSLTFFVADADTIPLVEEAIDCIVCFGTLHHVPDPEHTLVEAARVLKPGGFYLGSENNKTPLRPVFDLIMRLRPLWTEEAGPEAQMGAAELERWTEGSGLQLEVRPNVFVPPHLCNRLGADRARRLLRRTDAIMGSVPGIRSWGGLIEIVGRKDGAP